MSTSPEESSGFPLAVMVEGGVALAGLAIGWLCGVPLREQFPESAAVWTTAAGRGVIATIPMLALFWWLVHSSSPACRNLVEPAEWLVREMFPTGRWTQLALVAALAGVGEELLFRGVLQPLFAGWMGGLLGVLLASVLFGLAHALSRLYFLWATAIGAFLGWLAIDFHELAAPMLAHGLYDFLALAYLSHRLRRQTAVQANSAKEAIDERPAN